MESGNLDLVITLVSIIGTVLAAFGFLYRDLRRLGAKFEQMDQRLDQKSERMGQRFDQKLKRIDKRFERMDQKFDGLRTVLTSVQVSLARIEGHLGIGFPARGEQRADDGPPERAAGPGQLPRRPTNSVAALSHRPPTVADVRPRQRCGVDDGRWYAAPKASP